MKSAIGVWTLCATAIALPAKAGPEVGDYRALPQDLAAAATAYDVAQYKADRRELERWLADDYVFTGMGGNDQTKTAVIAGSLDPDRKTTYVAISHQVYKFWEDGAALGGIVDAKGTDHGKPFSLHARFVDVWAKRSGRWQVVFTQIDDVPSIGQVKGL